MKVTLVFLCCIAVAMAATACTGGCSCKYPYVASCEYGAICVCVPTGVGSIQGLTVFSSRDPSSLLTIGNNPFTISCTYTKQSLDTPLAIELLRKRSTDNDYVKIVYFPPPGSGSNVTFFDSSLVDRTTATKPSASSPTAKLAFDDIVCSDKADYLWKVYYYNSGNLEATSTVRIDSLKSLSKFRYYGQGQVTYTPSANIKEGDEVTFTCSGDVGDEPAGQLAWYMYRYGATMGVLDLSTQASVMPPVAGQCTYTRTSTLNLTMTYDMNNVVIRCTAQQEVRDEFGDNNNYRQTLNIPVLYAPKNLAIKKEPDHQTYAEGEQSLTLTCSANANPAASYYWVLPDPNSTGLVGSVLSLMDLNENDSGTYTCVGYNTINGQNRTVNTSVEILIQRATCTTAADCTTHRCAQGIATCTHHGSADLGHSTCTCNH